ncbi:MAG: 3'-5' exonuclease [Oscillatoriales cyanobacterium SM2_2_1]|nr:3'-5' exonuclease [Oscillatoriales cyanobacterium SM2_2_1]
MKPALTSRQLLEYYQSLRQQSFCVVDLETTGGNGQRDRIIEIAVVCASLREGIRTIKTDLINPRMAIPPAITRFTGISPEMVKGMKSSAKVLPTYRDLLTSGVLTAHNFQFDYSFLQGEFSRQGTPFTHNAQLCTVELSRLLLPHLPSRSLPNLVKHYDFKVGRSHRAEADAIACWLLLEQLFAEMDALGEQALLSRFGQQWLTLEHVALITGQPEEVIAEILAAAPVMTRFSRRRQVMLYQRQGVESYFGLS